MKDYKLIPCVYAKDFPPEVLDYCVEHEISTHYSNDVVYIEDDGNILSEFLKREYSFKSHDGGFTVGIFST